MKKLFNKSFFRFVLGFVALVAASFLFVSVVGFYQDAAEIDATAAAEEK
jgi:hypothetical protein